VRGATLFHRQFSEVTIPLGRKPGETAKADPDIPPEPVRNAGDKEDHEEAGEHSREWEPKAG